MTTITLPTLSGNVSKKLTVAITSLALVIFDDLLGWGLDEETIETIVQISVAYLVGQGIADVMKGKAQVEAKTKQVPPTPGGNP